MLDKLFKIFEIANNFYWDYIGLVLIILTGLYFTIKTRFFQFRTLLKIVTYIKDLYHDSKGEGPGIHPARLYFASIGGMVGLGNIAGAVAAVTIGGPGGIVWLWVASFAGMLLKYSEIFLGITHRVKTSKGFDGGPMYYLEAAFKNKIIPLIVSFILCIYCSDVYQFLIITDTVSKTLDIDKTIVIVLMVILVMYCAIGGITRLTNFCIMIMPPFMLIYIFMCCYVISINWYEFINMIPVIFISAFKGHAAVGGFAGSTIIMAAQYGVSRASYSGDIGTGCDSIIQCETKSRNPEKQARIAVFALFSDTLLCTLSCLVVLVTGLWKVTGLKNSEYVMTALSKYFPHMDIFMLVLCFAAGTSTVIAYLVIGLKCAKFISHKWGKPLYILYAIFSLIFFSYFDQSKVILILSLSGGLLMFINILGIIKLRHEIKFK